jgi:hypothetical protein
MRQDIATQRDVWLCVSNIYVDAANPEVWGHSKENLVRDTKNNISKNRWHTARNTDYILKIHVCDSGSLLYRRCSDVSALQVVVGK